LNVILVPIGSHGDVHPFVGIGIQLARRGHHVRVVANGHFRSLIESAGLHFVQFGDESLYQKLLTNPDLWNPKRAAGVVFASVAQFLRDSHACLTAQVDQHPDAILVTNALGFTARVLQEARNVPVVTLHLSPAILRSLHEMPMFIPGLDLSRWPRWCKRLFWRLADRMIDPHLCPALNALRRDLNLPPVKRVMKDFIHSPLLTIAAFPAWFAAPQPDWPPALRCTGFPLYDEAGLTPMPDDLGRFLDEGEPPIAFTPGSANIHAQAFFAVGVQACVQLQRRGLILTRFGQHVPPDLPSTVRHFTYAPFSELLPRCAALVHHGGIGTTAQALRAGCPQLIRPQAHDQFDNAARVARLGAGTWLTGRRFTARPVAAALAHLTAPSTRSRCADLAARFLGVDALSQTCDLIEAAAPANQATR
jgi:UDP:flavonoid glycosyltransferase YjiC (YdhE family)